MNTFILLLLAFAANLPLGMWRESYARFTLPWWVLIHASVPFIIALRVWMDTPPMWVPFIILSAVSGQFAGRKMAVKSKRQEKKPL